MPMNRLNHLTPLQDKIAGGLLGLLIGDALGVPYEFHETKEIPPLEQINYTPPAGFMRAHTSVPPATWSDDGAQALCLLASLLHCDKLDLKDFSARLLNWYQEGYMAVDSHVYDIGIATGKAMHHLSNGVKPEMAGGESQNSNGNGSLMRVLPLALWHSGTDEELMKDAMKQSRVTHRHIRSQLCCALYCLFARYIMQEIPEPWRMAVTKLQSAIKNHQEAIEELEFHIRPLDNIPPTGSGYVVDSLRAAKNSLQYNDYTQAVRSAIALGHDTDTTACIVGGIAGLQLGLSAINQHWLNELRGQELYQPLLYSLLESFTNSH